MPTMLRSSAKALAVLLCLLLSLHILSLPSSAGVTMMVSPTMIDLTLNTGDTSTQEISIRNTGDEPTRVRVYAMDFSIDRENNYTFSDPGHESYSCASWLGIEESDFDLGPAETKHVEVTISVPQEVEPGGHYAALFFETIPTETQPGVSVAIAGRIPSLFYLTIPGVTDADIFANAEITSLMLPGWVDGGPVEIGAVVRNTGNVHLTIAAKAYFTDFRGRQAGEIDLGQTIVLPGAERAITGTWGKTPFIGPTQATIVIGYFDQHSQLVNRSMTGSFQIIPWKVIIAVFASLALIAFGIGALRRKFRFKLERRNSE
jgi:P pilus assembly chaperone PapD